MVGTARAQDQDTITIPWPGSARAQDTIRIPCSHVEEFLHGAIDVPPGTWVTVTAHTLRSLTAAVGGPEKMARLMGTRVGRQWLSILKPISDEEFEWCSQRVQHELVRRQREQSVPRAELAVIPFTPGQPIYVDVRINDAARARLILDTGADRTMITPRVLRAVGLAPRSTATMRGVTGQATVDVYEIASLEVSAARVGRLRVFAHDTAEPASDGLLGRDFLDHFTVTIDNAGGQVTLSPKAKLAAVPPSPVAPALAPPAPENTKEVVREYEAGWYLLEPPLRQDADWIERADPTVPLGRWTQVEAFASATACENARDARARRLGEEMERLSKRPAVNPWSDFYGTAVHREAQSAFFARCVASDDPRLGKP